MGLLNQSHICPTVFLLIASRHSGCSPFVFDQYQEGNLCRVLLEKHYYCPCRPVEHVSTMFFGGFFWHQGQDLWLPQEDGSIYILIEHLHLMPISLDLATPRYLHSFGASQSPVWVTCKWGEKKKTAGLLITCCTVVGCRLAWRLKFKTLHDKIWEIYLTNELWCKYQPLELKIQGSAWVQSEPSSSLSNLSSFSSGINNPPLTHPSPGLNRGAEGLRSFLY